MTLLEKAHKLIDQLSEDELRALIALLKIMDQPPIADCSSLPNEERFEMYTEIFDEALRTGKTPNRSFLVGLRDKYLAAE